MFGFNAFRAPLVLVASMAVLTGPAVAAPIGGAAQRGVAVGGSPTPGSPNGNGVANNYPPPTAAEVSDARSQPYVPSAEMRAGHPNPQSTHPPSWPQRPKVIAPAPDRNHADGVVAESSGFDTASAGIGAGATLGALAAAFGGVTVGRRRRVSRSAPSATH
jgi:hypothetical protein